MEDPFAEKQAGTPAKAAEDFFATGSPSCRFTNIGDTHWGTITEIEKAQQRDIKTGQPKTWPDGNPCEMIVITLQTNERDADIEDDDGLRKLYVNKPSGMFAAIKTAIGKNRLQVGDKLAVKYLKNGKPKTAGYNPPKEYVAKYTPAHTEEVNAEGRRVALPPPRSPVTSKDIPMSQTVPLGVDADLGIDDDKIPF